MKRDWSFLINTFLVVTVDSYRKMKQLGDFTRAAFTAAIASATDPAVKTFFQSLFDAVDKPVDEFDQAYVHWLELQGAQKGQTRSLAELLSDLSSTQAEDWDIAVQGVYRQGSGRYETLLPHRRGAFQNGSQQDRITAVGAFGLAIGDDPKLADLKKNVNTVYDALILAYNQQKGSKSSKSGGSAEVEADRMKLAIALYGVLGLLMNHFKETPQAVAPYFLVTALRTHEQTEWEHDLKGGEQRVMFTRTFEAGDKLLFVNTGNTALRIARVAEKNSPMPADAKLVEPGGEIETSPDALGAAGSRYYIVKNESATEAGSYRVVLE